jgi:hypothetical protein
MYAPGWIRTRDRRIRSSAGRYPSERIWPDRADYFQGVRLSSLELPISGPSFDDFKDRGPFAPIFYAVGEPQEAVNWIGEGGRSKQ